jgi:hypothetical protein
VSFFRPGRWSAAGGPAVGFQPVMFPLWRFRGGFSFRPLPPYPQGWAAWEICGCGYALGRRLYPVAAAFLFRSLGRCQYRSSPWGKLRPTRWQPAQPGGRSTPRCGNSTAGRQDAACNKKNTGMDAGSFLYLSAPDHGEGAAPPPLSRG